MADTNKIVVTMKGPRQSGGVTGYATWSRLAEILRKAAELRSNEQVIQFDADEQGASFIVQTKASGAT